MKNFFLCILTCLTLLSPAATAIQLSDLSPTLNRTEADENLTKDYAYRILSDLSVRRIWNLDDNRKLTIDFEGKTGNLICIVVDYRTPVSLNDADKDAADIGKFEEATWRKFSSDRAAKYYMDRARAMKFDSGYMFEELSGSNKCLRLTFYPKAPKENRRLISEGSASNSVTAMGSTTGGNAVKALLEDEETRLYTANKTDVVKKKAKPAKKPVIVDIPEEEIQKDEEIEDDEPMDTESEALTPEKEKSTKTAKTTDKFSNTLDKLLAQLGLDGLETTHWFAIGGGLLVLIVIIGAIGRSNERRRIAKRAASLRRNTASVKASLKQKTQGDKSKLRIK